MFRDQPLRPTDLGLILSYHCQSECAHCIYNCGPFWSDWMEPIEIRNALENTLIWDHPIQVHLTGGEPFLNFPLLQEAVEITVELGIPCYCETNAGWCVNRKLTEERFMSLKNAGLNTILISCSPFHSATIPPKRTLLAIATALDVFGPQGVIVYMVEWLDQVLRFGNEKPTTLERYIQSYGSQPAGVMFWEGYKLISGGRSGYRLGHLTTRKRPSAFIESNCLVEILYSTQSHFDLYGNYISGFCGGLSIGDWHNLPEVIADFRNERYPYLVQILIEQGPFGIYQFAHKEYRYKPLRYGYAGKCHLCVDVRKHLSKYDVFPELKPSNYYAQQLTIQR